MPRTRRIKSNTGIYHVILKGIDDRNIFLEEPDKIQFLNCLKKTKEEGYLKIYAYCLMNNHVHLIIKEIEELGTSIKRITVSYSFYHNKKYARRGHLFNNRYRSVVIENEDSLLRVIAYIHQNPIKAGITKDANYMWSSHQEYLNIYHNRPTWINAKFIKNYYDNINAYNDAISKIKETVMDSYNKRVWRTDEEIYNIIKKNITFCEIQDIKNLELALRNKTIKDIKDLTNASQRQLSRILGIGRNIIERACL